MKKKILIVSLLALAIFFAVMGIITINDTEYKNYLDGIISARQISQYNSENSNGNYLFNVTLNNGLTGSVEVLRNKIKPFTIKIIIFFSLAGLFILLDLGIIIFNKHQKRE